MADEEKSGPSPSQIQASLVNAPQFESQFDKTAAFKREPLKFRDGVYVLEPDSAYDEDRKLVELSTVWSERDALQ